MSAQCIGEPISWLRLETHALDARDGTVEDHLAECPACSACFREIKGDLVALPPLAVPERAARRSWSWWVAPAMAAAAAAIVLLVIVRRPDPGVDRPESPENVTAIKGAGDVVLGIVRERAGTIRTDVTTFAPGDRFKVTLTCQAGPSVWVDVAVIDPAGADYPLGPHQISCGNQVAVPGAFSITGRDDNRVCARLDPNVIPARSPPRAGDPGVACVTLRPESGSGR